MAPVLEHMTPEALAVAAQRGDGASWAELARRMRPPLRAFLIGKLGHTHDADDIAQEAFLRAQDQIERYDPRYRFSTWLFTIAARLAISQHRRRSREQLTGDADPAGSSPDVRRTLDGRTLWQRAEKVLSPRDYHIMFLRYSEDLSVAEIASHLGISQVSTKVTLYRARKKLAAEDL